MSRKIEYSEYEGVLPSHMKIDFWEAYAKHVIEYVMPARFPDLEYRDKPDLQSFKTSTGIEVTSAIPPENEEAESLHARLSSEDKAQQKRDIERIEQLGGQYVEVPISEDVTSHFLSGPNGVDSFDRIHEQHQKKLDKLNGGGYADFEHYQLFVRSPILANDTMLHEALTSMLAASQQYAKRYEFIYVEVPEHIYLFDLTQKTCRDMPFNHPDQYAIGESTRREVYQAEQRDN